MKKWIHWTAGALVVGLAGAMLLPAWLGTGHADDPTADYTREILTRGNLQVEVTGNGSVKAAQERTLYASFSAEVNAVYRKSGEAVREGEVIAQLDDALLEADIAAARDRLEAANNQLRGASLRQEERRITVPVKGRVKLIAGKGDDVSAIRDAYGAIAYLSQDDSMQVTLAAVPGLADGESVTLVGEQGSIAATVASARNAQQNTVLVTQGDEPPIQRVQAYWQGELIGEGLLLPHRGIPVLASQGTIASMEAKENDSIAVGATLFWLEKDYSETTLALFAAQQEAQRAYDAQCAKRAELAVCAPFDGVLVSLSLTEGETLAQGRAMVTVQRAADYEVVAAIDELDIALVAEGQRATVTMDAVKGVVFEAVVLRKASVGSYQGGVTTYDVTLALDADEGVLAGMSAEVRIGVADRQGALLLPKTLVAYRGGKPYVLTEQGEVPVTLGLASHDQVEILDGLREGQAVLVKQEKAPTGMAAMQMGGGMGMGR